ncbi:MAG: efflux RND transporter periplasmic adaptor subunit [Ardenticatenaceae bacterium]|nr:efflux RND transporter periplasmic adaptor subunit [Ardenticatenaceae bacterium]
MKRAILILIMLALIAGGYFWWTTQNGTAALLRSTRAESLHISGSGTIEAETVAVAAEAGGRIISMGADEGDAVAEGEPLVELDATTLEAQRTRLLADLAAAEARLASVSAAPQPEAVAAAEAEVAQAQAARDGAFLVWQTAQAVVQNPFELNAQVNAGRGQIAMLEQQVEAARAALKTAQIQRGEAARDQGDDEARTRAQAAVKQVEAAQANLAATEAELAGARSQFVLLVATRDRPLALIAQANTARAAHEQAVTAVQAAVARLALVKAGPRPEKVAIAAAQVRLAETALARLDVQRDQLTLAAPHDGIVTVRAANPGELAAPGATLLRLSDLDRVTLTVFLPETQIGWVRVGQTARVTVDAYPGETFEGMVTFIASEAEFTPRNVQTRDERVSLVFAVKIRLDNADHRLKPGMPADAEMVSDA